MSLGERKSVEAVTEIPVDDVAACTLLPEGEPTPASASRRSRLPLGPGARVGRYVVLSRLGSGAMGVVVGAYDPQLDRKIALKLLEPRANRGPRAQSRLLREAQALARLNHSNVVAVHDVGTHDGRVFIAMEFIEGQTLGAWMDTKGPGAPRPWRTVLEVFVAAGRGLAAAHQVGLIHRDFKPDNVMLGRDGRVKVMDFGLARDGRDDSNPSSDPSDGHHLRPPSSNQLTRTGALVGTPAYMAPEQYEHGGARAHSDQFGYCVSLYEALFGQRPFQGDGTAALAFAITHGHAEPTPSDVAVPRWLRRIVLRGLSVDPRSRFDTMLDLVRALEAGEAGRRRKGRLAVLGGLAITSATGFGVHHHGQLQRVDECAAKGDAINEVWSPRAREAVRAAFVATGSSQALVIAEKVTPWLDRHARTWRAHATEVCTHTHVDDDWDDETAARALWCLQERKVAMSALLAGFGGVDSRNVHGAVDASLRLPRVEPCTDDAALSGMAGPPPYALRSSAAEVRFELVRARHARRGGQYEQGLETVRRARARAEALSWTPLLAEALVLEGELLLARGDSDAAEQRYVDGYMHAARSQTWDIAAEAAIALIDVTGRGQARYATGETWAAHAEVALTYAGDRLGLGDASRLHNLGVVHFTKGDRVGARQWWEQSLAIKKRVLGPAHPDVARILNNLGVLLHAEADYVGARSLHERSLQIRVSALGEHHPDVARTKSNLANVYNELGDYEKAQPLYLSALEIQENTLGHDHPHVAQLLSNVGAMQLARGELEDAEALHRRALAIWRDALPPQHPDLATSLHNLAGVRSARGYADEALGLFDEALAIREHTLGPDHPDVANTLDNLGSVYSKLDDLPRAQQMYERALEIREAALGSEHPSVATALRHLGGVHLDQGRHAVARGHYEQSLKIFAQSAGPEDLGVAKAELGLGHVALEEGETERAVEHLERAFTLGSNAAAPTDWLAACRFSLSKALWLSPPTGGGDRPRAVALAVAARDTYDLGGPARADAAQEVQQWIDDHPLPRRSSVAGPTVNAAD